MFEIPEGLRIALEKVAGRLSDTECAIYDAIVQARDRLNEPISLELLTYYRTREVPRIWDIYGACLENRHKPYFLGRLTKLVEELDRRLAGKLDRRTQFSERDSVVEERVVYN